MARLAAPAAAAGTGAGHIAVAAPDAAGVAGHDGSVWAARGRTAAAVHGRDGVRGWLTEGAGPAQPETLCRDPIGAAGYASCAGADPAGARIAATSSGCTASAGATERPGPRAATDPSAAAVTTRDGRDPVTKADTAARHGGAAATAVRTTAAAAIGRAGAIATTGISDADELLVGRPEAADAPSSPCALARAEHAGLLARASPGRD
jgi:hypothetical protein